MNAKKLAPVGIRTPLRKKDFQIYEFSSHKTNQSRTCGKGVGLGPFPSISFESQSYEFIEIAHSGQNHAVEFLIRIVSRCIECPPRPHL